MWLLRQAMQYVQHRMSATSPSHIHSPYLFELLRYVHDRDVTFYAFDELESIRDRLLKDRTRIPVVDLGAGSHVHRATETRTVSQVARTALTPPARCQLIFRMLTRLRPAHILELGTSLGILTAYLASAQKSSKVHTIEGNPAMSAIAQTHADLLELRNMHFHAGAFDSVLPGLLDTGTAWDFVVIDGDHRGEALKNYYTMIRPHLSAHAVVLVDDIRWSADMYAAWQELSSERDIRCSLDYYWFGLVFYHPEFLEKVALKVTY